GMPAAPIARATRSASSRLSSSRQALSGPDSSQQARQRAVQRLVSCQATKRGARYSSTERPCTACAAISGEADVRLRHHLVGDVLHLRRLPACLAARGGLADRGLLRRLGLADLLAHGPA